MPPRPPPRGGRGGPPPPPPRGGAPPPRGGARVAAGGASAAPGPGQVTLAAHVQTIGVKKPGYGREGRPFQVFTNHFGAQITDNIISHYDGQYLTFMRITLIRYLFEPRFVSISYLFNCAAFQLVSPRRAVCSLHHVDPLKLLVISPSEKVLPARLNFDIIESLQVS